MDASTIVSIIISLFSIGISVFFAYTGFRLVNDSDKTLASIQAKLDAQHDKFMTLLQEAQTNLQKAQTDVKEVALAFAQTTVKAVKDVEVDRGEWSSEKEAELNEVLLQMRQRLSYPASVLSIQNKVGEREEHG